tara:strand:- start:2 stop:271 length:270 start_codon:yes stop_codon:yes gene_type:complete
MKSNIEQLKKRIIYRSNYRGTKEMDKLLGAFVKEYIDTLNDKELLSLEKFLEIDDSNLYNYYNNLVTDINFDSNRINLLFKNFEFNKKK